MRTFFIAQETAHCFLVTYMGRKSKKEGIYVYV